MKTFMCFCIHLKRNSPHICPICFVLFIRKNTSQDICIHFLTCSSSSLFPKRFQQKFSYSFHWFLCAYYFKFSSRISHYRGVLVCSWYRVYSIAYDQVILYCMHWIIFFTTWRHLSFSVLPLQPTYHHTP